MEKVDVPAAPGRLISAVARIGYDPEVALCDLIDNSLDADGTHVFITLVPELHPEDGETDTLSQYIISDDGCGMDRETLVRAFTLGSNRKYPPHALGKFGLGLKSAGLSLGNRIVVLSKTADMLAPLCAVLPMAEVEATGEYKIDLGEVPAQYQEYWTKDFGEERQSGTTLILEELNENQPSYSRFLAYFRRYCAQVYHLFLADTDKPLVMGINSEEPLEPVDPLFFTEAKANGPLQDPENWDGKTVHLLLDNHGLPLTASASVTIALTNLVHPISFEQKRGEMRDRYMIEADPYTGRRRHGFYIYRNRRIIVLAEGFHGLVSTATQAWAFRGRLMFDETADNILALDVKKRHCQLPKEARSNLQAMVRTHQQKSTNAWAAAGRRAEQIKVDNKEKAANESITNTPIGGLDYAPGADLSSSIAVQNRQKAFESIRQDTLKSITDKSISEEVLEKHAEDKSLVVLVDGLKGNSMWLPYPSVHHGAADTLVNQQHSWLAEAYAAAEADPKITIILHQIITLLARAELEVRSMAWPDVPANAVDKVLERFRKKASMIGEDLADSLKMELAKIGDGGHLEE